MNILFILCQFRITHISANNTHTCIDLLVGKACSTVKMYIKEICINMEILHQTKHPSILRPSSECKKSDSSPPPNVLLCSRIKSVALSFKSHWSHFFARASRMYKLSPICLQTWKSREGSSETEPVCRADSKGWKSGNPLMLIVPARHAL